MTTINQLLTRSLLMASCLLALPAQAEIAVVVNNANGASLSQEQVSKVFLGKDKSLTPVMVEGAAADEFVEKVLARSPSQYKAYWAKLAFTGGGRPPKTVGDAGSVLGEVAGDPKAIGVVDASAVNGDVKVLFTL
ncbi:type 2 periplasmic-binding domain-containing protein [Salinimonas sediminis]|uniref:Phosphate ABC transporter substrate-binding protein n=1 Tax=Salinimonas sediminis TaxID=2303538 RepID=A0A346NR98_9ALTE|nr:phosphate ABC transporter substrate-binding protein [Salinimonas sediminis]AXR08055.1 phosphate ABC transporter substrate-binding protein [Salinimonas sediminis]